MPRLNAMNCTRCAGVQDWFEEMVSDNPVQHYHLRDTSRERGDSGYSGSYNWNLGFPVNSTRAADTSQYDDTWFTEARHYPNQQGTNGWGSVYPNTVSPDLGDVIAPRVFREYPQDGRIYQIKSAFYWAHTGVAQTFIQFDGSDGTSENLGNSIFNDSDDIWLEIVTTEPVPWAPPVTALVQLVRNRYQAAPSSILSVPFTYTNGEGEEVTTNRDFTIYQGLQSADPGETTEGDPFEVTLTCDYPIAEVYEGDPVGEPEPLQYGPDLPISGGLQGKFGYFRVRRRARITVDASSYADVSAPGSTFTVVPSGFGGFNTVYRSWTEHLGGVGVLHGSRAIFGESGWGLTDPLVDP